MNTESLLEIASFSPKALNFPNPWVGHLPFAAWVVRAVAPRTFVELGTHTGNSYFAFCQSVAEAGLATRCFAVDTWEGDIHAGEYGDDVFAKVDAYNAEHFSSFSQLLRVTFDQALDSFVDQSIDLLHIDGLHTYEAVRHDFETWLPKLSPGAIVIFHDTNIYERGFGVWRFWQELQIRYRNHMTFLHSCGLGVLQIDTTPDTGVQEWLQPQYPLKNTLIAYFLSLGFHQLERYELTQGMRLLNQKVAEQDDRIASLCSDIAERDNRIAKQDEKIAFLRNDLAGRENQIAALLASTSWRITLPLRLLRRLAAPIAAQRRLVKNICLLAWGQIRLHGPLGVLRRIPYYRHNFKKILNLAASQPLAADGGLFSIPSSSLHEIRLHPDLTVGEKHIDASISFIIPTLNAGVEFPLLLRKLVSQLGLGKLEIVIVDSGSHDDTVGVARAAGCTVVEITPADFSHSHARNVGADAASGQYLLFMVQDAFPIGMYWAYGMLAYLLEHSDLQLAAASCAEYSRSDSDMMYDSMINTHYRFLGCLDYDRIGEFQGNDHMALRANGQLSDVACLISKEIFNKYRYRGNYAEDLDLGIRLIQDGYRVAMLASIKVIHSHNRSAYYYLKRSFVDVVFLTGLFADFSFPKVVSPRGIIAGIVSIAAHLSERLPAFDASNATENLHQELEKHIALWRKEFKQPHVCPDPFRLGDANLDAYVQSLSDRYLSPAWASPDGALRSEMNRFLETFLSRLEHFNAFAQDVYGVQDSLLHRQLREVVLKTFCAAAGASIGFMYVGSEHFERHERQMAETLYNELKAGI